ncbi:hypothetical protein RRG08_018974 [Elysia crispata]|uniref:Uncharacterized protein n=1 Tax=Elysia crispata TaxID=231223 RepID=A0AAE1DTS3_9GAST|nr:hypothetical protein RRG08_018974 [Elysia crispata]
MTSLGHTGQPSRSDMVISHLDQARRLSGAQLDKSSLEVREMYTEGAVQFTLITRLRDGATVESVFHLYGIKNEWLSRKSTPVSLTPLFEVIVGAFTTVCHAVSLHDFVTPSAHLWTDTVISRDSLVSGSGFREDTARMVSAEKVGQQESPGQSDLVYYTEISIRD